MIFKWQRINIVFISLTTLAFDRVAELYALEDQIGKTKTTFRNKAKIIEAILNNVDKQQCVMARFRFTSIE